MLKMDTIELSKIIRRSVVEMTSRGNSSHVASGLSIADILAVLYGEIMTVDPAHPQMVERDRFILSKGHAGAAVYATLSACGFFPSDVLKTHCQDGSILSGHVSHKDVPGVEFSTGSLGHGLPVGAGMAYCAKLDEASRRVFVLLSDGECDEGSNWEAMLFAAHHQLDNLYAIIDYNKLQSLDSVKNTLNLEPFADKWRNFGWAVEEVDGHDHHQLSLAFDSLNKIEKKPKCILAHTTKGKGVSFMENTVLWHYRSPQGDELKAARMELE